MKKFSDIRRKVPSNRKKFGKPETKKEMLNRLKEERNIKENKSKIIKEIKEKNKDEFHFGFYSVNKNMIKKIEFTKDELKKTLKYVESEIKRVEGNLESNYKKEKINKKIIFSDSENEIIKFDNLKVTKNEYEKYVEELQNKKLEILEHLNKIK